MSKNNNKKIKDKKALENKEALISEKGEKKLEQNQALVSEEDEKGIESQMPKEVDENLTKEGDNAALFIASTQFNEQIFKDFSWANMLRGKLSILIVLMGIAWIGLGLYKLIADKDIIFGSITLVVAFVCLPLIVLLGVKRMAKNLYKNYTNHTGGKDQNVMMVFFDDYFAMMNNDTGSFAKYQYDSISRVFTHKNLMLIGTKTRKFFMVYKTDFVRGEAIEAVNFLEEHITINKQNAKNDRKDKKDNKTK